MQLKGNYLWVVSAGEATDVSRQMLERAGFKPDIKLLGWA